MNFDIAQLSIRLPSIYCIEAFRLHHTDYVKYHVSRIIRDEFLEDDGGHNMGLVFEGIQVSIQTCIYIY